MFPTRKGYPNNGEYLQAIINSLEDELMVIDRDYRVVQTNEAVLKRHGKANEEVIGRYCYGVSHGLSEHCRPPHHECPVKAVWETGKPARVTHLHTYDVNNEKQERYLDIIASPILDGQGKIIAVAELMRDTTETKKMELKITKLHQELKNRDEIRGELLNEILSIQEEERKRIARELHDET
ncbi:MAG: PAS domain-containing protein, partial [Dehalococcoidales bacterium]